MYVCTYNKPFFCICYPASTAIIDKGTSLVFSPSQTPSIAVVREVPPANTYKDWYYYNNHLTITYPLRLRNKIITQNLPGGQELSWKQQVCWIKQLSLFLPGRREQRGVAPCQLHKLQVYRALIWTQSNWGLKNTCLFWSKNLGKHHISLTSRHSLNYTSSWDALGRILNPRGMGTQGS